MNSVGYLDDFRALEPFFRIVEEALVGLADGAHFPAVASAPTHKPSSTAFTTRC
jgi:hypothetical protein